MEQLLKTIEEHKRSQLKEIVDDRIKQFERFKTGSIQDIFKELCFCLMTANCAAEKCIEIHKIIDDDFLHYSTIQLSSKFKELGYRFPNIRSQFIIEARNDLENLEKIIINAQNEKRLREGLVKNIKGLGYKEASHFLRNIGYKNLAIIDFHIIDVLEKNGVISKPKTLTKKKYLEIEEILAAMAKKMDLSLSELDLYLWFLETGKVLK